MTTNGLGLLAAITFSLVACQAAEAVTPVDGVGTTVVLPVVANTPSFATQVFIHNPNGATLDLDITYIGGNGTALPGLRSCTVASVAPDRTLVVDVGAQCTLGAGSNFGQLRFASVSAGNVPFTAYARVQNPGGIGFSIEGVPAGLFAHDHVVSGLRSGGAGPAYQTNCFVGTLGEAADYQIALYDGATATQLGTTISGSLAANALVRVLDVFAAASVPAGAYSNINAYITENTVGTEPAITAFCTVQENTNFSADYRIGKSREPLDSSRERQSTATEDRLGNAFTVQAGITSNVHQIHFRAPDRIWCELTGPDVANLEMRLLDQAATGTDATTVSGNGRVIGGGSNLTAFGPITLAARNAATLASRDGAGVNGRYILQVEGNESAPGGKTYGISCRSGNGHTRPEWFRVIGQDLF